MLTAQDQSGSGRLGREGACSPTPVCQYSRAAASAISAGLFPVVALVGNEVLQDHLLYVAVSGVRGGERLDRFDPLLLGLADPDEDPARERDLQLAGRLDRLQAPGGMLRRRAGVDGLHQPLRDRLQHQPLRGRHLTQAREILAREHTQVRVRQQATLQRSFASPYDVRGEVLVPVLAQPHAHLGVDLGMLAGEHEQLLDLTLGGTVEYFGDLIGGVQMRLVRRESAVLAVAAASPRQRQRQVAREGDSAAHRAESRGHRSVRRDS